MAPHRHLHGADQPQVNTRYLPVFRLFFLAFFKGAVYAVLCSICTRVQVLFSHTLSLSLIPLCLSLSHTHFLLSTDELQYITMTGCNTTSPNKMVILKMPDITYTMKNVSFNCDANKATVASAIFNATSLNVHVAQVSSTSGGLLNSQVIK